MDKRTILIVEKDDDYFADLQNGFGSLPVRHHLQRVKTGKLLLEFLSGLVIYKVKLPDLILFDLIIPETTAIETLELIKVNAYISDIPVIIYTSSIDIELKKKCLESGAHSILRKAKSEEDMISLAVWVQEFVNSRLPVISK